MFWQAWTASGKVYGYRKLHDNLREQGETCYPNRVARLAKLAGIKALIGYKRRPGSYGGKPPVIVNKSLARQFNVGTPDKVWVTDIDALEEAKRTFGLPHTIRVDNGCQLTSKELDLWAYANSITLDFSRLGKPTDNAYAESFNATVRLECLGQNWFMDLDAAVLKVEEWRREYNEVRPHSAIGDSPPMSLICKPRQTAAASKPPEFLS